MHAEDRLRSAAPAGDRTKADIEKAEALPSTSNLPIIHEADQEDDIDASPGDQLTVTVLGPLQVLGPLGLTSTELLTLNKLCEL